VIIVEPRAGEFPNRRRTKPLRQELLALGAGSELTRSIDDILFHRNLPVDVRHNAKINREALAVWAERRLR
jgi:hypothetical protein